MNLIKPIGHVDVEPEQITAVVQMFKKDMHSRYQDLLKEAVDNLATNSRYYDPKIKPVASKSMGALSLFIPGEYLTASQPRYVVYYAESVNKLVESPLKTVVEKTASAILKNGFHTDRIEVNFENGCMYSQADYWHRDGSVPGGNHITVCFSSKTNWSTRVVDLDYLTADIQQLEALSFATRHGDLWHANLVTHRAPKATDLQDDPVTSNDWRLFMRFSSR